MTKTTIQKYLLTCACLFLAVLITSSHLNNQLISSYQKLESSEILDRHDERIALLPNSQGYYSTFLKEPPNNFKKWLLNKEDRFFYFHLGINPISIFKNLLSNLGFNNRQASSTISQQLAKTLLHQENKRTIQNKIKEILYAFNLELYHSKDEILTMYVNTIYFGNQIQGLKEASQYYFNVDPNWLSNNQIFKLLATINSPTNRNPLTFSNTSWATYWSKKANQPWLTDEEEITDIRINTQKYIKTDSSYFELSSHIKPTNNILKLTADKQLTTDLRKILSDNLANLQLKNAHNGAIVVIKLPENEILSIIGSPNVDSGIFGRQIDMSLKPRAIGSTIKPFIYLKAFEKGARPYTLIDDKESRYITNSDFSFYPQNYDYKFRGPVSMHYALSNSLNIPAARTLEYVGVNNFSKFLKENLGFIPFQDIENYQLSMALGGLEMSLYDLSGYFTIFPKNGIWQQPILNTNTIFPKKSVASPSYIQLVNKILSDRQMAMDQFSRKSELNLNGVDYSLKTGTSIDYRDSWVIGYTPDVLVGVWVGNADNTSMDEVSGQTGAGKIWFEAMNYLLNTSYNQKNKFDFNFLIP
ncbi:MAG: transglycosylase domain-containing protein, partial [Candidatus Parcubacteria bacterium]|nr:transglycosylase domain-containing protein [Candidatus Parcubacteria bacterium]